VAEANFSERNMFRLAAFATAAAAVSISAAPALAAPVHITIPGDAYVYEGTTLPPATDNAPVFQPPGLNLPFDPAQAALAAMQFVPWAHENRASLADNGSLIRTLARTGESFSEHWSRCEARYASYSVADNTYLDAAGVPRNCGI
jgi:hypothetical protein